jgi:peptidoglycan/LPS O-acetylase OafA/YrhL
VPRSLLALAPLMLGWTGVAIFFVVSGFCIHYSHQQKSDRNFKSFFIRRFFRIYPPYLAALILLVLLLPWTWLNLNAAEWTGQITSHAFLFHNFSPRFFSGINPSLWSIGVEAQLYLLYPLLLLLVKRFGWKGTLGLTGSIEISLRGLHGIFDSLPINPYPNLLLYSGPLSYWYSWTIGAKLADDWRRGTVVSSRYGAPLWVVLAIGSFFIKPLYSFCFLLVALAAAQAIAFLLSRPALRWPPPGIFAKHLRRVGLCSYSFYLLHQPLLSLVPWFLPGIFPGIQITSYLVFLGCLVFYWPLLGCFHLFYRGVEQTSNALGRKMAAAFALR